MRTLPIVYTLFSTIYVVAFCQTSPTRPPGVEEPPEFVGEAKQPERLSEPERLIATVQIEDPDYTAKLLSTIDEVIRHYPEYPNSYSMRVERKYCASGAEYSGLMDDTDNAIKYGSLTPDNTSFLQDLFAQRAKIEFVRGDHQRAIEDLEHAVFSNPLLASYLFRVPSNESKANPACQWNIADLNVLGKEYPTDYRIYLFKGLDYEQCASFGHTECYGTALRNFQKAIEINPKVGLTYYYMGENIESTLPDAERSSTSSQPTDNDKKLLQAYGTALTLDPALVPAYMARANIHIYLKHPTLALSDYGKAIELQPRDHHLYNRRAQLLMDNGKNRDAIADFPRAIDYCGNDALCQAYHEQRADVLMRVGDYGDAVKDLSESIRLLIKLLVPHSLGLKQFRKLYPEYNALTDERLAVRLHAQVRESWEYHVFSKRFVATTDETGGLAAFNLSEDYAHRADAYWLSKDYKRAILDYQRIFNGFPAFVKKYSDTLDRWQHFSGTADGEGYIDVRTVDYSQPNIVKLWVKTVGTRPGKLSTYSIREAHINCASRLISTPSIANYDNKQNVVRSVKAVKWESILPDTLGEALYEGLCKE